MARTKKATPPPAMPARSHTPSWWATYRAALTGCLAGGASSEGAVIWAARAADTTEAAHGVDPWHFDEENVP